MPMYKQWVLAKDAPVLSAKGYHELTESDFELIEEHTSDLCKAKTTNNYKSRIEG